MHLHYDAFIEWASCRVAILTDFSGKRSCRGLRHPPTLTTMGNFGYQSTCGILLCRREEVLSAPRVLLVLKRSFTVSLSSLDVFFVSGWCVVLCLFGFFLLFFVLVEDIQSFAFSPVLQQLEIS